MTWVFFIYFLTAETRTLRARLKGEKERVGPVLEVHTSFI